MQALEVAAQHAFGDWVHNWWAVAVAREWALVAVVFPPVWVVHLDGRATGHLHRRNGSVALRYVGGGDEADGDPRGVLEH